MPIQFLSYTYQRQLYECFCGEQRVFQKFILGGSELLYFHSRYFCALLMQCCLFFVNIMSVNLVADELFLYFSHILLNCWMTREWFYVVFVFEKQNNMSFVKSVFFLFLFNLAAKNVNSPKVLYHSHNKSEINPGE